MASHTPWATAEIRATTPPADAAGDPAPPRAQLPTPLTTFVGRTVEIAEILALLHVGDQRLLTLTGPGGVGKTRLAIEVASRLAPMFPNGAAFVPLATLTDPEHLAPALFQAFGGPETGLDYSFERLLRLVAERRTLLVLDNFEHLIAAATVVSDLLAAAPDLRVLVTSRLPLHLSGEQEYQVLPFPLGDRVVERSDDSPPADAVRLFILRAGSARSDFSAPAETLPTIAEICRRLDGLPLAIELAAARVTHLSARALLARMDDAAPGRLPLLTGGPQDLPRRQQTMRATIAWSFDLLPPAEQDVFRQLSVFTGGFPLGAAAAVCAIDELDLLEHIGSLVAKNLLVYEGDAGEEPRYHMLETIREFGREEITRSGHVGSMQQRHAAWAVSLAEEASRNLRDADAVTWLERIDRDYANLRAAMTWALAQERGDLLFRFATALLTYWDERVRYAEGRQWLEAALSISHGLAIADRNRLFTDAGSMAWRQTDYATAIDYHQTALALARTRGDRDSEAFSLNNLGVQAKELGRYEEASGLFSECLDIARADDLTLMQIMALHNRAQLQRVQYQSREAMQSEEAAVALTRERGDGWIETVLLIGIGLIAADLGDVDRARAALHDGFNLALARQNRGNAVDCIESLARLAGVTGQALRATRLFGAGSALREQFEIPSSPAEQAYFAPMRERLVAALGADRFTVAWTEGRALPLDAAITEAFAVQQTDPHHGGTTAPREPAPFGLTGRELAVLALIAAGHSNREIAASLYISPSTAARHVANIYLKLDVESRAAAIASAHQHRLLAK